MKPTASAAVEGTVEIAGHVMVRGLAVGVIKFGVVAIVGEAMVVGIIIVELLLGVGVGWRVGEVVGGEVAGALAMVAVEVSSAVPIHFSFYCFN